MMTEQIMLFIKEAQSNEDLKAKLAELEDSVQGKDPETARSELIRPTIALAKEYGYDLTELDFEMSVGEISDEELEALAGGVGGCGCAVLGGGGGAIESSLKRDQIGSKYVCACVGLGVGRSNVGMAHCACFFYGTSEC